MNASKWIASVAMCAMLAACGGGGGGGGNGNGGNGNGGGGGSGTSITASAATLDFDAYIGANADPVAKQLTITFTGAGVVVGTRPGETLQGWAQAPTVDSQSATQIVFSVRPLNNVSQTGNYTQVLRFVTAKADQTDIKFVDVTIRLHAHQVTFPPANQSLSFVELDGDPDGAAAEGTNAIQLLGETGWHVAANQPWVSFGAASGTGAGAISVSVERGSLPLGSYQAIVTVTEDMFGGSYQIPVLFVVRPAQLTVSPGTVSMTLNRQTPSAPGPSTLHVSDELDGQVLAKALSWTATVNQPWLQLSATSGTSAPSQNITVQLKDRDLALMSSGDHSANIRFDYVDSGGVSQSLTIPFTAHMQLPSVRAVTPYFIPPNTATTVRVRGEGLAAEDMDALSVVGVPSAVFERIDDTRANLILPTLPAGSYEIVVENAADVSRSTATIVVGNAVTIGAGVIESPNVKRLVFDEQRGRLFAIDRAQFQIESYTWNGSAWVAGTTISVPEVADAALSRSGKDLVIVARNALSVADANDLSAPLRPVWTRPQSPYNTSAFSTISINDQGAALIAQTYIAGSGATPLVVYDALRENFVETPVDFPYVYEGQMGRSPGGRFTTAGEMGVSSPMTLVFDSFAPGSTLLGSMALLTTSPWPPRDVDYAGTRMLETSNFVRNMQGALLGTLGAGDLSLPPYYYAVLSPNGTRAFKLVEESSGSGRIDVYNLLGTPTPDYPVIGTLAMPARIADPTVYPYTFPGGTYHIAGQVTRDGKFLILAGPERTVVLDITGY